MITNASRSLAEKTVHIMGIIAKSTTIPFLPVATGLTEFILNKVNDKGRMLMVNRVVGRFSVDMNMPLFVEALARKFGLGIYSRKPEGNGSPPDDAGTSGTQTFSISEDDDFYVINEVRINDEVKTVKWTKHLLDEGKSHTQDQWVVQTKEGIVRLVSLPAYIATIITLYDNKDVEDQNQKDLVEKVRKMFEVDFDPADHLYHNLDLASNYYYLLHLHLKIYNHLRSIQHQRHKHSVDLFVRCCLKPQVGL
jgi:hypothetical protein